MFQIIYEGEVIGLCDKPRYINKKKGIWVECKKDKAEAIAFKSVAYEGARAKEVDGSEYAFEQTQRIDSAADDIVDTQDALCEATDDISERLADIEDALCELTEQEEE